MSKPDIERVLALFRTMHLIRAFEERVGVEMTKGNILGSAHQSTGQEAVATGVVAHLRKTDYLFSNHRGHGHALAKGANPFAMWKELFGRVGGTCGGKGGSMHIADFSVGMLGANGIVADGATMAVGAAQAIRLLGEDRIVVAFIGDGTINRGPFSEALNWAKVYELPVLFVIEDNVYASTTVTKTMMAGKGVVARSEAFGVPAMNVDGNDVIAVSDGASRVVAEVRAGKGPRLIHATTYRVRGHLAFDKMLYRDKAEIEDFMRHHEPIGRCRRWLIGQSVNATVCDQIENEIAATIDSAVNEALAAAYPDARLAYTDIQDMGAPVWHG
ncbi:MAG: thiamine pyrophosphate-dependent dehydrogenase E1 component subunit alpha [Burkholderiales bacterium]